MWQTKRYFIVTEGEDEVFYLEYKSRNKYDEYSITLGDRENTSKHRNMFWRVIYTLLFMGYEIQEDWVHNKLSIKAIRRIAKMGLIHVKVNGEYVTDITKQVLDNPMRDDVITYEAHTRDRKHLLERGEMFDGCVTDLIGNQADILIGMTEDEDI